MDLGSRLRELRGDWTQKDLADALEVSPALVSSWESGNAIPPIARLRQYIKECAPGNGDLLDELLELRDDAGPVPRRVRRDPPPDSIIEILRDIRWLLSEIKDRLPPTH